MPQQVRVEDRRSRLRRVQRGRGRGDPRGALPALRYGLRGGRLPPAPRRRARRGVTPAELNAIAQRWKRGATMALNMNKEQAIERAKELAARGYVVGVWYERIGG